MGRPKKYEYEDNLDQVYAQRSPLHGHAWYSELGAAVLQRALWDYAVKYAFTFLDSQMVRHSRIEGWGGVSAYDEVADFICADNCKQDLDYWCKVAGVFPEDYLETAVRVKELAVSDPFKLGTILGGDWIVLCSKRLRTKSLVGPWLPTGKRRKR